MTIMLRFSSFRVTFYELKTRHLPEIPINRRPNCLKGNMNV